MAPAIVNEVTVIRVAQGNGVPHFTVGLLRYVSTTRGQQKSHF